MSHGGLIKPSCDVCVWVVFPPDHRVGCADHEVKALRDLKEVQLASTQAMRLTWTWCIIDHDHVGNTPDVFKPHSGTALPSTWSVKCGLSPEPNYLSKYSSIVSYQHNISPTREYQQADTADGYKHAKRQLCCLVTWVAQCVPSEDCTVKENWLKLSLCLWCVRFLKLVKTDDQLAGVWSS